MKLDTNKTRGGARKGAGRKPVKNKKKPVSITLTDMEKNFLDDIAKHYGLNRSEAVSKMIKDSFRKMVLEPDYKSPKICWEG